jgi:hypothetical protein
MKLDYDFALEMANGIGLVLTLVLALVLTALLITRTRGRGWRYDQVTQLNIGMILIMIGICVRLGFGWVVVRCSNQTPNKCGSVEGASWLHRRRRAYRPAAVGEAELAAVGLYQLRHDRLRSAVHLLRLGLDVSARTAGR